MTPDVQHAVSYSWHGWWFCTCKLFWKLLGCSFSTLELMATGQRANGIHKQTDAHCGMFHSVTLRIQRPACLSARSAHPSTALQQLKLGKKTCTCTTHILLWIKQYITLREHLYCHTTRRDNALSLELSLIAKLPATAAGENPISLSCA